MHGRYHAFDLALALRDNGAVVRQVATTYPTPVARRFLPADIPVRSAPLLELRRRLYGRVPVGPKPDLAIASRFGRFAAKTLPSDADVFVGWSSASLEALEAAKTRGMLAVVERGSTHILHQRDVLHGAYEAHGLRFPGIDPGIVERELAEYRAADVIAVPTRFVAGTFTARGIAPDRLLVNPYGIDAGRFSPGPNEGHGMAPVILFVGGVGIRKGAPELVSAFSSLAGEAMLVLAGPVEPGWSPPASGNIRCLGAIAGDAVVEAMRKADIFCLPSREEGLALSLLQAMASGLAVVATPESGAAELISNGVEGYLVEAGDTAALAEALGELIASPRRRTAMGRSARARALEFTWTAYGQRALEGYKKALGMRAPV